MIESLLDEVKKKYTLEKRDRGEFSKMKVSGMKFDISSYSAPALGNISTMSAEGFFGLMKMETLIVVPIVMDMPLLSLDYINAAGNETLIIELYDTLLSPFDASRIMDVKKKYASVPDKDAGKHWYDDIKLKESIYKKDRKNPLLVKLAEDYLTSYLESPSSEAADIKAKAEKTESYVNGLLAHGGPSTDVFKKKFGEEKTALLFKKVLFPTEL